MPHSVSTAALAAFLLLPAALAPESPSDDGSTEQEPTAQPGSVVSGDVLYFQDIKEFEPRLWDDGSAHGGIARLATVLDQQRTELGDPLVAFGGELAGGSVFGSFYRGMPFVEAFNELRVDVGNLGNHDFDYGEAHARDLMDAADFPWISASFIDGDGAPVSPDGATHVDRSGELTVGFLALGGEIDRTVAAGAVLERPQVEAAREAVDDLQAEEVDVVVLLSQISRADTEGVMEQVPEIDLALREENDAQSPAEIHTIADGRYMIAPEADYGTVIHARLSVDRDTGEVAVDPEVIPVDEGVDEDPRWVAESDRYYAELDERLADPLGEATRRLDVAELGVIVADSYREYFGADIGWQNGGGIRAELPAGTITRRAANSVLPFGNGVVHIETTGAALRTALEQGIESNPEGGNGFPRTAGLTFEFDPNAPFGRRVTSMTDDSGAHIEADATYTVAISQFLANGGDGVDAFLDATTLSDGALVDIDALGAYLENHGAIPVEGGSGAPGPDPDPLYGYFLTNGWDGGRADHAFMFGRHGDQALVGDWDGDGTDTISVRRGTETYVNNAPRGGAAETVIRYGRAGDEVLVGDWDGDGVDTLAARRGATYHLRNTLSGGPADTELTYGRPGDVVLVGDWDGDGVDTLAVRRGAEYLLSNRMTDGWADTVVVYGRSTDEVLVGDWDGDGVDTLTVRRGNTFFVDNLLEGGPAQLTMSYGRAGDTVIVGDWDGDGTDTVGVRRTPAPAAG
jgi:5'-nucleotidase